MAGLQSRAVNRAKLGIELMYFCQAWYEIKLVTTQYLQYDCTEGVEWLRDHSLLLCIYLHRRLLPLVLRLSGVPLLL